MSSRIRFSTAGLVAVAISAGLAAAIASASETVQPGVVLHDAGKPNITLSGFRSGEICADIDGPDNVCNTGTALTVQGHDTCVADDGKTYPCTRYGYRYDYAGARPGTQIDCTATRRDAYQQRQKNYSIAIDALSGSIVQPEWIPYNRVDKNVMLTEVHECTYLGAPLATIEYIITYEASADPETPADRAPSPNPESWAGDDPYKVIDEPYSKGVPVACNYLTRDLASLWVRVQVASYAEAKEHMPLLRSHCAWFNEDDPTLRARMEHKYHLYELFDVENRTRDQLLFHAAFAAGGYEPEAVRTDIGKITFIFQLPEEDRSGITVVTGIQGPPDGAGRPRELLAHYQIRDPNHTHQERLACLFSLAEKSLELWFSIVPDADNRVDLPSKPGRLGANCRQ